MNVPQLVSAVVAHAERQHEDSVWDIVATGMRRDEIATVLTKGGARTQRSAIRAMKDHLASMRTI